MVEFRNWNPSFRLVNILHLNCNTCQFYVGTVKVIYSLFNALPSRNTGQDTVGGAVCHILYRKRHHNGMYIPNNVIVLSTLVIMLSYGMNYEVDTKIKRAYIIQVSSIILVSILHIYPPLSSSFRWMSPFFTSFGPVHNLLRG